MGHWILAGLLGGTWGALFVRWCARRDAAWHQRHTIAPSLEVVRYQPSDPRRMVVIRECDDGVFRAS